MEKVPLAIRLPPHLRFISGGVDGFSLKRSPDTVLPRDEREFRVCRDAEIGKRQLEPLAFEEFGFQVVLERILRAIVAYAVFVEKEVRRDWGAFKVFSHLRSWLCVPLVASQQALGLLSLGGYACTGIYPGTPPIAVTKKSQPIISTMHNRLLILLLLKIGTPSKEIGMALNVHSSIVRRMFPGKEIGKIKKLQ